jgi:antitoxin (DNA-binding transcriptional repressor) of toxin-antitoxin stability system
MLIMIMVNIADAKARLSEYLEAAAGGETVLICRHNRPVAELRALETGQTGPRDLTPMFPGETFMTDGFFEPMTPDELKEWEGTELFPARVAERPAAYQGDARRALKRKRTK